MSATFKCNNCGLEVEGIYSYLNDTCAYAPLMWWSIWNKGNVKHACSKNCKDNLKFMTDAPKAPVEEVV